MKINGLRMQLAAQVVLYALIIFSSSSAFSQTSFYQGKTIRLIVGLAPGGGYDLYSRVIARQIGRHIPGNPTIVVENMDGAGSLIAWVTASAIRPVDSDSANVATSAGRSAGSGAIACLTAASSAGGIVSIGAAPRSWASASATGVVAA